MVFMNMIHQEVGRILINKTMVRIYWKSKFRLVIGNGTQEMTVKDAKNVVKRNNREFLDFHHWYGK